MKFNGICFLGLPFFLIIPGNNMVWLIALGILAAGGMAFFSLQIRVIAGTLFAVLFFLAGSEMLIVNGATGLLLFLLWVAAPWIIAPTLTIIGSWGNPRGIELGFLNEQGQILAGGRRFREFFQPQLNSRSNFLDDHAGSWIEVEGQPAFYSICSRKTCPGGGALFITIMEQSQKRRREEALQEADTLSLHLDTQGEIIDFNERAREILQFEGNGEGEKIMTLLPPGWKEELKIALEEIVKIKEKRGFCHIRRGINRKKTCWQWTLKYLNRAATGKGEVLLQARDISREIELQKDLEDRNRELRDLNKYFLQETEARQETERKLVAEKELLDITLRSIREGVITTDKEERIRMINRAAMEITGWNGENIIGEPLKKIYRVSRKSNTILQTREGKVRVISESFSPIKNEQGDTLGYILIFGDITELKSREDRAILSQKMESIGQLAAGIAHEINTPMQYIGDNLSFLQKAFSNINGEIKNPPPRIDKLKKEVPHALEDAIEGVKRVNRLVLSMKNFAHPGDAEMKMGNINEGIKSTLEIAKNEWKYATEVKLDLDNGLPQIFCRMEEINQVILNMVVNSAQAIAEAREKGIIEKGLIKISTLSRGEIIQIIINDNGAGISSENKEKIFDPFFTTKEVGKGTGQGLTIAHDIIVNKHKGELMVASEPGQGTTFTINLPLKISGTEKN